MEKRYLNFNNENDVFVLIEMCIRDLKRLKASIEPRDDPVEIPKPVKTVIDTTKSVIPYISNATTKVMEKIADVGATATTKLIGEYDPNAKPTVLSSIASTTLNESYRVWSGLTNAGSQVFVAGKDSVCEIVNHRFGLAASQATDNTITLGKDIATTTSYIRQAGITTATMTFSKVLSINTKGQPVEIELDVFSPVEETEEEEAEQKRVKEKKKEVDDDNEDETTEQKQEEPEEDQNGTLESAEENVARIAETSATISTSITEVTMEELQDTSS